MSTGVGQRVADSLLVDPRGVVILAKRGPSIFSYLQPAAEASARHRRAPAWIVLPNLVYRSISRKFRREALMRQADISKGGKLRGTIACLTILTAGLGAFGCGRSQPGSARTSE